MTETIEQKLNRLTELNRNARATVTELNREITEHVKTIMDQVPSLNRWEIVDGVVVARGIEIDLNATDDQGRALFLYARRGGRRLVLGWSDGYGTVETIENFETIVNLHTAEFLEAVAAQIDNQTTELYNDTVALARVKQEVL